jgi:hypothetical protein
MRRMRSEHPRELMQHEPQQIRTLIAGCLSFVWPLSYLAWYIGIAIYDAKKKYPGNRIIAGKIFCFDLSLLHAILKIMKETLYPFYYCF